MGSTKSPKSTAITTPSDPDPTPIAATSTSTDVQSASRQERKRAAASYGRKQTILAGNSSADNANKKTILGG